MDKKFKNSSNVKGYNLSPVFGASTLQSDKLCENSYLIPTTAATSIAPVILTPTINSAKDVTGLNQYQHHRSTRQRTCSAQHNALQPAAECSQSTLAQKNHINNNVNSNSNNINNHQIAMSAKAAACVASPMEQLAAVHAKATSSRNKNEGKNHQQQTLQKSCTCTKVMYMLLFYYKHFSGLYIYRSCPLYDIFNALYVCLFKGKYLSMYGTSIK